MRTLHDNVSADLALVYRCAQRLKSPLPLLAARDQLKGAWLRGDKYILVDSSTGSGKSTQLPQYLAECATQQVNYDRAGGVVVRAQKLVVCVEPRTLAAVTLADYVAREYDDPQLSTQKHVQCLTDFNSQINATTHIVYTTGHMFLQLVRGGQLNLAKSVFAVMVDDAHERAVEGDMVLGV